MQSHTPAKTSSDLHDAMVARRLNAAQLQSPRGYRADHRRGSGGACDGRPLPMEEKPVISAGQAARAWPEMIHDAAGEPPS